MPLISMIYANNAKLWLLYLSLMLNNLLIPRSTCDTHVKNRKNVKNSDTSMVVTILTNGFSITYQTVTKDVTRLTKSVKKIDTMLTQL